MRISPVGFAYDTIDEVFREAERSASSTHNHPEGIKGAQAVASGIYLAKKGKSKIEIKEYITNTFNYGLEDTLDNIRIDYRFDETCQGVCPRLLFLFLNQMISKMR